MKFMTEVHWHYDDEGIFTHCSFSHIEILSQEGDIIIAKDEDGFTFRGGIEQYYETDEEAVAATKQQLQETIVSEMEAIARIKKDIYTMDEFLSKI